MKKAPKPVDEEKRLCAVRSLKLLDTVAEERFDDITRKATLRFGVPISTITLIDKEREWFKSVQGLSAREGDRDISFCGHALYKVGLMVVEDTLKNKTFAKNPMVVGYPFVRFYVGKALYDYTSKKPVGVFCIKDIKPRYMSFRDVGDFLKFAELAEAELNSHSQ